MKKAIIIGVCSILTILTIGGLWSSIKTKHETEIERIKIEEMRNQIRENRGHIIEL